MQLKQRRQWRLYTFLDNTDLLLFYLIEKYKKEKSPKISKQMILFAPNPLGGGEHYILKWVSFVLTILADRYINRREMWVES